MPGTSTAHPDNAMLRLRSRRFLIMLCNRAGSTSKPWLLHSNRLPAAFLVDSDEATAVALPIAGNRERWLHVRFFLDAPAKRSQKDVPAEEDRAALPITKACGAILLRLLATCT
jgi:hypothetical protein